MKSKICFLIMAQNEEHCILETLKSTLPYANEYLLLDNGSIDNTIKVCEDFFTSNKIKFYIFNDTWKDFEYNYTKLYQLGYDNATSDYLWQIDADDLICGNLNIDNLTDDTYMVNLGDDYFRYHRTQLWKRCHKCIHIGKIHGYINFENVVNCSLLDGDYYIDSRRIGNRHKLVNIQERYNKDAELLVQEINKNTTVNSRYIFYAAQCYFDSNQYDKAIEYYTKYLTVSYWKPEEFYAIFRIAMCYENLKNYDMAIKWYEKCENLHPNMAEANYSLGLLHLNNNNINDAIVWFEKASNKQIPAFTDYLFIDKSIYTYKALYQLALIYNKIDVEKTKILYNKLLQRKIPNDLKIFITNNLNLINDINKSQHDHNIKNMTTSQQQTENTVFVKYISYDCTEEEFQTFCKTFPGFVSCKLIMRKFESHNAVNKGYGFVTFDNEENMNNFIAAKTMFKNHLLYVVKSEQKTSYPAYIKNISANVTTDMVKSYFVKAESCDIKTNKFGGLYCLINFPTSEDRRNALNSPHMINGEEYSVYLYKKLQRPPYNNNRSSFGPPGIVRQPYNNHPSGFGSSNDNNGNYRQQSYGRPSGYPRGGSRGSYRGRQNNGNGRDNVERE